MDERESPYITASVADALRKLADLREEDALTQEEFEAAKSQLFVIAPDVFARELRKLDDLREEGALTEEEFEAARSQISAMPPRMLNIPAGDSEVYVIPPHMLKGIAINPPVRERERKPPK